MMVKPFKFILSVKSNIWYLKFTHMWYTTLWTNFLCHSQGTHKQIIKIYIYMRGTLESLDKFIESLMSCTQGVSKFALLLASCTQALNKFVALLTSCMPAHDLMQSWSVLLARTVLCYLVYTIHISTGNIQRLIYIVTLYYTYVVWAPKEPSKNLFTEKQPEYTHNWYHSTKFSIPSLYPNI